MEIKPSDSGLISFLVYPNLFETKSLIVLFNCYSVDKFNSIGSITFFKTEKIFSLIILIQFNGNRLNRKRKKKLPKNFEVQHARMYVFQQTKKLTQHVY